MQNLKESSNLDYHNNRSHLSSSTLKMILKDSRQFYHEWVLGNKTVEEEKAHFTEGSFLHTLVLEPHLVSQYAIFPGLRKAGKVWEEFKAAHPNQPILSMAQVNRCEQMATAYQNTAIATALVQNGFAEHTLLSNILDVPIKTRPDYIVPGKYIVDVKTTSMPTDTELFRQTVTQYSYELSAALYCQVAFDNFKALHDFYWIVLSKDDGGCAVYKASSATLSMGAAMFTQAIVKYKKCLATNNWDSDNQASPINEEVVEI
jgi:hypothetical protein